MKSKDLINIEICFSGGFKKDGYMYKVYKVKVDDFKTYFGEWNSYVYSILTYETYNRKRFLESALIEYKPD